MHIFIKYMQKYIRAISNKTCFTSSAGELYLLDLQQHLPGEVKVFCNIKNLKLATSQMNSNHDYNPVYDSKYGFTVVGHGEVKHLTQNKPMQPSSIFSPHSRFAPAPLLVGQQSSSDLSDTIQSCWLPFLILSPKHSPWSGWSKKGCTSIQLPNLCARLCPTAQDLTQGTHQKCAALF